MFKNLKDLRVRSKTLGKWGLWLTKKQKKRERDEEGGATLSGFSFGELQGLLAWPGKQMADFLFCLVDAIVIRGKKVGSRIKNATCNAHHCLVGDHTMNQWLVDDFCFEALRTIKRKEKLDFESRRT